MLSYGCSPSCVNGSADEAALDFSAEFMTAVISLSLADETRDEMTARGVWSMAFTKLNHAANVFRTTPSWEPPHVLAQVFKSSALQQMDDGKVEKGNENPTTTSGFRDGQPAPGETIDAGATPATALPSVFKETPTASCSTASPRLEPGPSIPPQDSHKASPAPEVPPTSPHPLPIMPLDADGPGGTSSVLLPTNEGTNMAISKSECPSIREVVLPDLSSIRPLVVPEKSVLGQNKTTAPPAPSVPSESTAPVPKPAACNPANPPQAPPAAHNAALSSETTPPSTTVPAPIKSVDKRVHWSRTRRVIKDSDSDSSLTSLNSTKGKEGSQSEIDDADQNENESDDPCDIDDQTENESEDPCDVDEMPRCPGQFVPKGISQADPPR